MNNLKRILSLALASVMVLGMMVIGASAVEFTDADEIVNSDAVNSLVALNVIGGFDDGSFQPEGNVTRAQMAKMIAVALNGGKEDFRGSSTGSQFVDVPDGKWYVKFVNYCASKGIVNGIDATHFNPEGNVTAQEAAVMIMRAMGFRNESFMDDAGKFSWSAVNDWAESIGLYDDTSVMDLSKAADRQNAAQIIYNGIQQPTAKYTMTYNSQGIRTWALETTNKGQLTGETILTSAYGAKVEYAVLTGTTYNAATGMFSYGFNNDTVDEDKLTETLAPTATDYSALFMQKVRVVHAGKDILGISAAGNNIVGEGVGVPTISTTTGKINGLTPSTASAADAKPVTKAYKAYNFNDYAGTASTNAWSKYVLIDNNGDNLVDAAVCYPVTVEQVKSVANGVVTFEGNTQAALTIESTTASRINATTENTLAAGDYVTVAKANTLKTILTKVDVTENVTATVKATVQGIDVYTVGGQKYKLNAGVEILLGKAYDMVAINGYVLKAVVHSTGAASTGVDLSKIVYVTNYATGTNAVTKEKDALGNEIQGTATQKVELMFTDGTTKVVDMVNLGTMTAEEATAAGNNAKAGDPKPVDKDNNKLADTGAQGTKGFYTYTEKDGKYSLVALSGITGYEKTESTAKIEDGIQKTGSSTGTLRFDDGAILFVNYKKSGKDTLAVMSGADVNGWETPTVATIATELYNKANANGFKYVGFGYIDLKGTIPGAAQGKETYGWIVANAVDAWNADANDGKGASQPQVTIWTGTENVTYFVNAIKTGTTAFAKSDLTIGNLITYKLTNGVITTLEIKTPDKPDSITALSGTTLVLNSDKKERDFSDATILYISSEDYSGVATGTVQMANKYANGDLIPNVYALVDTVDSKDVVLALVVDVERDLDGETLTTGQVRVGAVATVANFPATTATNRTITVVPTTALKTGKVVDANGDELFDIAALLSGSAKSNEAAIVKIVIPGMKQGDKLVFNPGDQVILDASATHYQIIGNRGAGANDAGEITIEYYAKTSEGFAEKVTYTLQYAAWGTAKTPATSD